MDAVSALSALAQESRLTTFRLLIRAGDAGMAAGDIARELGVPHNTLSSHLACLARSGLVTSTRQSRSIIYRVDFAGTRELLAFLLEDCCQGQPEVCSPAIESVLSACCAGEPTEAAEPKRNH